MTNLDSLLKSLTPEEYAATMKILGEVSESGRSKTLDSLYYADYTEVPVSIDEFVESDRYAGWYTNNGKDIYPYWREQLRKIFTEDSNYSEVAITGSIGTGKSHIAVISLAYCLYKLMCLRDPHAFYGIAKGGYIYIVFFNATLTLSQGVAYTKFQSLLRNSPWFLERGSVTGKKYLEYIPNGPIRFTVGSQMEHSIGKDIIYGILDEVNFVKGANIQMEKSKIMQLYNSVLERINSRFIVRGRVEGKLFLVSSKKSEYDFMESYIRKQIGKPGIYVIDAKLWEVKPQGTYSGQTFRVAVGGSNMPSRIIPDNEPSEPYIRMGYDIIEPPIEFKGRFEMDINAALMNIAGLSISNVTKFITYENVAKNYMDMHQPFQSNILTIGTKDSLRIRDFFVPELIPSEITSKPIFIHFDCSLTGDRTGIGAVATMGYVYENEYDIVTGQVVPTKQLVYRQLFTIGIQCPSGAEISFQKSRDFIYYLKNELRWNIKGISTDGYQSADMRQQFITMGFDDTSLISLDRKPDGYLALKSAINEKRIALYNIDELETELINLEQDNQTGKVDHKPEFSKDMSDGLAGALYNASLHSDMFSFDLIERASTFTDTNYVGSGIDYRDRFLDQMVPKKFDPSDIDYLALFDMHEEKNKPKEVLDEIQKAHPEMSLKDAVANYLDEIKQKQSEPKQEETPEEKRRKAHQMHEGTNIPNYLYDEWQNIKDMNDGILSF